jgi:hypothetical protein
MVENLLTNEREKSWSNGCLREVKFEVNEIITLSGLPHALLTINSFLQN